MDEATKEVLLNLLKNVRRTTDDVYQCYEMALLTYSALLLTLPTFYDAYTRGDHELSFEKMLRSRADQTRQLDAAILLLEAIESSD